MKEICDIIKAYQRAEQAGMRCALATVVKVEGSSYRRPGARMLVTQEGNVTGAISGGCLEGDARRKALYAILQQKNTLVTYNSMDEDGELFGIQLGCNGIIHILFEPIMSEQTNNPIILLQQLCEQKQPACLVTLFQMENNSYQGGTCLLACDDFSLANPLGEKIRASLMPDIEATLTDHESHSKDYSDSENFSALLHYIPPPISLVIAGAGNDAMPLASIAHTLGWHITIIDGRATHATQKRFPLAEDVRVIKLGETPPAAQLYMLMSHNYPYDMSLLRRLLENELPLYIGLLGPKKKRVQMLADMKVEGVSISQAQEAKLFGPAGLDIGAETAEEIALSIIAEMQSVLARSTAQPLRDKQDFIHRRVS